MKMLHFHIVETQYVVFLQKCLILSWVDFFLIRLEREREQWWFLKVMK